MSTVVTRHPRIAGVIAMILALSTGSVAVAGAEQRDRHGTDAPAALLYLELVVNETPTGRVVRVEYRDGRYFVAAADIEAASVRLPSVTETTASLIEIEALPGVAVEYDSHNQRLKLTVPVNWLPRSVLDADNQGTRLVATTSFGVTLNYDAYASGTTSAGAASLWTEGRVFDRWGSVSTTGVLRRTLRGPRVHGNQSYLRYDTAWSFVDDRRMLAYTAGDLISDALPWTTAVRLAGVSISRNFSIRPDLITHPMPEFAGEAAVPTAVDLLINGRTVASARVPAGPFTVNNAPILSGAGTATVVTTDALGRRVETDVSFYVANTLLRPGLVDYSLSAGMLRRDFGFESFSYGPPGGSGSVRYGLSNAVTVSGHAEVGRSLFMGGGGAAVKLARFGVLDVAAAYGAQSARVGRRYAAAYSYVARRYGVMLQHSQQEPGFSDLSTYDGRSIGAGSSAFRRFDRVTGAVTLGRAGGSVSAGYFYAESEARPPARVVNLSYGRALTGRINLSLVAHRTLGARRSLTGQAQVTIPLGRVGTVSTSVSRQNAGEREARLQYAKAVPSSGGVGWNIATSAGTRAFRQGDVTWRSPFAQMQGGVFGSAGQRTRWVAASGSLVMMDGGFFPTNRVHDTFVLVSTDRHPGIPVLFENRLVGRTNRHGHLLVPGGTSYYPSRYEIDPLNLDPDLRAAVVERLVSVRKNSGATLSFPIRRVVAAVVALVDDAGIPLPFGTSVMHEESGVRAVVGWEGLVYFEDLRDANHLAVMTASGRRCSVAFPMNLSNRTMTRVGPLRCLPQEVGP